MSGAQLGHGSRRFAWLDQVITGSHHVRMWIARPFGLAMIATSFFAFFTWSSLEYHDQRAWRSSVLNADAAGYYIYLPGLFQFGFRASAITDSATIQHSSGFRIDRDRDRIITKCAFGTALFELPFYLVAEWIDGADRRLQWSRTHERAIEVGGMFYWTLGLVLLGMALRRRWGASPGTVVLVLGGIAFGTNTFYYAFREPGYSHVASFFLCALALFLIWRDHGRTIRSSTVVLFAFTCAAIVAVRSFDILLVMALSLLFLLEHPRCWRSAGWHALMVGAMILVHAPQLAYWQFVHGTPIFYSYAGEGFTHASAPLLAEVLGAPENGLLPHAPFLALLPFGLVALWRRSRGTCLVSLCTFAAALYGFASWHAWHFGCSYGMRPFVQYTPLAAVALVVLFDLLRSHARPVLHGLVPLLVIICFLNYRAMLQYHSCYDGGPWDWMDYLGNLVRAFFARVQIHR